ncbi:MAG: hypothetical protein ACO1NQ_02475 [Flavobacteriales bacterium]
MYTTNLRSVWRLCPFIFFLTPTASVTAQDRTPYRGFFLGVGMGQDVGGLPGARATYWVAPYLSGFVGGGWAFVGGGWNAGVELRMPAEGRTQPFVTGMYGYNGIIRIEGLEKLNGIYLGPTVGGGIMVRQRQGRNYWRFSLNLPFRSQEMLDAWETIKARPDVTIESDLLPVTVGVGFHFSL